MSRRAKLEKFAALDTFENVFQNFDFRQPQLINRKQPVEMKGQWNQRYFDKDAPITLELACGTGAYTLGLAKLYPERHFIGVDVKGNRIWKGAESALLEQRNNVAFVRTRIEQLDAFFEPGEVSEIWITFPDPFSKERKANRRLTAQDFLKMYHKLIGVNGTMHLKTDAQDFFEYSLEQLDIAKAKIEILDHDIYAQKDVPAILSIQTKYEKMHLAAGKKIQYVRWRFTEK